VSRCFSACLEVEVRGLRNIAAQLIQETTPG